MRIICQGADECAALAAAVHTVLTNFQTMFAAAAQETMRERACDIEDIKNNLLHILCGEAAANTDLIPKLIEWGLDEFSVAPERILQTRKTICAFLMRNAECGIRN